MSISTLSNSVSVKLLPLKSVLNAKPSLFNNVSSLSIVYIYLIISVKLFVLVNEILFVIYLFVLTGLYFSTFSINLVGNESLSRVTVYSKVIAVTSPKTRPVEPKVILRLDKLFTALFMIMILIISCGKVPKFIPLLIVLLLLISSII